MDKRLLKTFLQIIDYDITNISEDSITIKSNADNNEIILSNDFFKRGGELKTISLRKSNNFECIRLEDLKGDNIYTTTKSEHNFYSTTKSDGLSSNLLNIVNMNNEEILTNDDDLTYNLVGYYKHNNVRDLLVNIIQNTNYLILRIIIDLDNNNAKLICYSRGIHFEKTIDINDAYEYIKGILNHFNNQIYYYVDSKNVIKEFDNFIDIDHEFIDLFHNNKKNDFINELIDDYNNDLLKLKRKKQ